jgi:hypothetical protein
MLRDTTSTREVPFRESITTTSLREFGPFWCILSAHKGGAIEKIREWDCILIPDW